LGPFLDSIEIVLPVVLMLVVGRVYARARGFSPELSRGLGSLVFWVCLPALTCREIIRADSGKLFDTRLCGTLVGVIAICAVIGYRYARLSGAAENKVGVISQGSFRSNMMYVGLPVLIYYAQSHAADSHDKSGQNQIAQLTAVAAAISIPLMNIATILAFELPRRKNAGQELSASRIGRGILLNPLVVAVAFALLAPYVPGLKERFGSDRVPGKALDLCAAAALPLALFTIGANLDVRRALTGLKETLPVAFIKLVLMPAMGFAALYFLGEREAPLAVGVVLLACPDAATGHAMAAEYGGDEDLAGELVAVTTLLCPLTLVGWLSLLAAVK